MFMVVRRSLLPSIISQLPLVVAARQAEAVVAVVVVPQVAHPAALDVVVRQAQAQLPVLQAVQDLLPLRAAEVLVLRVLPVRAQLPLFRPEVRLPQVAEVVRVKVDRLQLAAVAAEAVVAVAAEAVVHRLVRPIARVPQFPAWNSSISCLPQASIPMHILSHVARKSVPAADSMIPC